MPFVTRNGVRLWYEIHGEGDPVFLLHGFTMDSSMWSTPKTRPTPFDLLFTGRQLIFLDARGHGKSDSPASGYARHERIADLLAVIETLGLKQVDLIGFSMGGSTSLGFTLEYPERVRSLTLVATNAAGWNMGKKLDTLFEQARTERIDTAKEKWLEWSIAYNRDKGRDDIVEVLREMISRNSGTMFADPDRPNYPTLVPDLDRARLISVPTLIQIGSDDKIFVPLAKQLHREIAGSKFSIYEGRGHLLTMEEPVRWGSEVNAFLTSVAKSQITTTQVQVSK